MKPGVYKFTPTGMQWTANPPADPVPLRRQTGTGLEWMEGLSVMWTAELRVIVENHTEVFQVHRPPRCHTRRMCLFAECLTKCYGLATRPCPPKFPLSPSSDWLPITPPLSLSPSTPTSLNSEGLLFELDVNDIDLF